MKSRNRILFIFCLLVGLLPIIGVSQTDKELLKYKEYINKDSLESHIKHLESYGSRYGFNPNNREIAFWLRDKLIYYDFKTKVDSFYVKDFNFPFDSEIFNNSWQYNIIADKKGVYSPDTAIVFGAHYDSYGNRDTSYFHKSPGADDNASGVAAILEIARLYKKLNLKPIKTLRIELYALEEAGLIGSNHAVRQALEGNTHIGTMVNLDMIAYNDSMYNDIVNIIEYDNSNDITELALSTAINYTDLIPYRTKEKNQFSDSYSYYSWGGMALFIHEGGNYPFYHTSQDLTINLDMNYFRKTTQLAFCLAYLCVNTNDYYPVSLREADKDINILKLNNNPIKGDIRFYYNEKTNNNDILIIRDYLGRIVIYEKLDKFKVSENNYNISNPNLRSGFFVLSINSYNEKFIYLNQ